MTMGLIMIMTTLVVAHVAWDRDVVVVMIVPGAHSGYPQAYLCRVNSCEDAKM